MLKRHFSQDSEDCERLYDEITNLEVHIVDAKTKEALHSFEFTPEALLAMYAFRAQFYSGDQDHIPDFLGGSEGQRFVEDVLRTLGSAAHACVLNKNPLPRYEIEEPDGNTRWPLDAPNDDDAIHAFRMYADKRGGYGWWALHKRGEEYNVNEGDGYDLGQRAYKWTRVDEYHRQRPERDG